MPLRARDAHRTVPPVTWQIPSTPRTDAKTRQPHRGYTRWGDLSWLNRAHLAWLEAVHVDRIPRHGSASRLHVHMDRAVTFWKINHGPTLLRIGNVLGNHDAFDVALNCHASCRICRLRDQHRLSHQIRHLYLVNFDLRIKGHHVFRWHTAIPLEGSKLELCQCGVAATVHSALHERWRQCDREGETECPQRNEMTS